MTVATFQIPNQTVDNPGVWFPKNDGNWKVAQPMVGPFACHEAATPNMTVVCDAGAITFAGQMPTVVAQQISGTITAPAVNPRKDLVVIDANTGVSAIVTGTAAASPVDPAVPEGKIAVARITLATSTTTITNTIIDDLRGPVLAVQGSPPTLSIGSNTTLTQKQLGLDVFCSGAGVTITLPSPSGCKGGKLRFMGTDANTQTLSGSFSYPDSTTASSHGLVKDETLDVESTGSLWRVVNRQGGGSGMPSGAIMQFGGATAPVGWMICAGAALSRTTYANLFAAIGTAWGVGDGSTTFNIPNGAGRTFIGAGTGSGLTPRTLGASGGAEAHALTSAENGTHSHGVTDPGHSHAASSALSGNHSHVQQLLGGASYKPDDSAANSSHLSGLRGSSVQEVTAAAGDHSHGITVNSASTGVGINNSGSGTAHNNMQPFLAGNWIIKT